MTGAKKKVVVGVGGGIAAYKAVLLVRELQARGMEVHVAMTNSATKFVGKLTFDALTNKKTVTTLWEHADAGEIHIELSNWADAMVIAPATMNLMARLVHGMADDPVVATAACMRKPVLLAPAMHESMWQHPATQQNVETLRERGVTFVGPERGALASGEIGEGRMSEPSAIADALENLLLAGNDLTGLRIVISAGPTVEDIDPVRFISNRSSGKMGYAIAQAAQRRGAEVVLVTGPTALPIPRDIRVISVRSAVEMRDAVISESKKCDAVVMAAAVADYHSEVVEKQKIKKSEELTLRLVKNPDILAELGAARGKSKRPLLIGFALETEKLAEHAQHKLQSKGVDLVVGNLAADGIGHNDNKAVFATPRGIVDVERMSKEQLAHRILDEIKMLEAPDKTSRRPRSAAPN